MPPRPRILTPSRAKVAPPSGTAVTVAVEPHENFVLVLLALNDHKPGVASNPGNVVVINPVPNSSKPTNLVPIKFSVILVTEVRLNEVIPLVQIGLTTASGSYSKGL